MAQQQIHGHAAHQLERHDGELERLKNVGAQGPEDHVKQGVDDIGVGKAENAFGGKEKQRIAHRFAGGHHPIPVFQHGNENPQILAAAGHLGETAEDLPAEKEQQTERRQREGGGEPGESAG